MDFILRYAAISSASAMARIDMDFVGPGISRAGSARRLSVSKEDAMKARTKVFSLLLMLSLAAAAYGGNVQYRIVDLGNPLGGTGVPFGIGNLGSSINDLGWIAGEADLPGSTNLHAELWRQGDAKDLGTLGGPNSAVAWPNRNDNGLVVGISETADMQPLGEQWSCALAIFYSAPADGHVCRGFVWQDDEMTKLPTLGGDNGFATGVNNARQIVGW